MARKKNGSEFVDPRTVLCQPLHSPHTAGTGAGRGRLRAGRRRGRAGMSAIIVSGAYGQKNVTYMSYPYVWRPVTPGGTAKTGGRGVAARATGRSPPRAAGVSARAYGAKGTSSTAISSAEHVAHVMGDGLFAAPASSGTPPSLNARPPYFEGRKHADRVGALGLGLCGAPVHAAVRQPPPTTCSGKDRQPTADRLRSAHNRRQMYERALGRTVSGQLPVHFGVWEFMDPNLEGMEGSVRAVAQRVRTRPQSLASNEGKASAARQSSAVLEPWRTRPSSSPMVRPSPPRERAVAGPEEALRPEPDALHASLPPRPATSQGRRVDFGADQDAHVREGVAVRRTERSAGAEDPGSSRRFDSFRKSKGWFRSRAHTLARQQSAASSVRGWSPDPSPGFSNSFGSLVGTRPLSAGRPPSASGVRHPEHGQPPQASGAYSGPAMGGALQVTPAPIRLDHSPTHRHRRVSAGLRERRVPIEVEDEDGADDSQAGASTGPAAPAATPLLVGSLAERGNNDPQHLEPAAEDGAAEASHTPPVCHGSSVHASVGSAAHAELVGGGMPAADGASSGAGQPAVGSAEVAKREACGAVDTSIDASRVEALETSMLSHTSLDSSGVLDDSASVLDESLPLVAPVPIRVDVKHQ